jgi:uncharacterized protein (UPF0147 family)
MNEKRKPAKPKAARKPGAAKSPAKDAAAGTAKSQAKSQTKSQEKSRAKGTAETAAKAPAKRTIRGAMSVAMSARRSVEERVLALTEVPMAVGESEERLQSVLSVLRNADEPVPVRRAALQTVQTATFSATDYPSWRGEYIAALREVAEDPDPGLRQRALGILAREKDGFAQTRLLEGLQSPEKALVSPEKALQLLSYDVHAEAYGAAREIVSNPPNTAAKREALRLLAADASAAPVFERVLRDKGELPEIRQVSAAALQSIRPEKLQEHAREILLDPSEPDEMLGTSLAALTQFGDSEAVAGDAALLKRVNSLRDESPDHVQRGAHQFLSKYGG